MSLTKISSALSRPYELESKIAKYPRIVIGDELIEYLEYKQNIPGEDIFIATNKKLSEVCFDLITLDDDGYPFLDYLGKGFRKYIASKLDSQIVEKAYQFITTLNHRCQIRLQLKSMLRLLLL